MMREGDICLDTKLIRSILVNEMSQLTLSHSSQGFSGSLWHNNRIQSCLYPAGLVSSARTAMEYLDLPVINHSVLTTATAWYLLLSPAPHPASIEGVRKLTLPWEILFHQ